MVCFFRNHSLVTAHKSIAAVLALLFLVALFFGAYIAAISEPFSFSKMHAVSICRVSIVGLSCAAFLPLLFSAFAVYIQQHWLLIPIAFLKAFCFSYFCSSLVIADQSAGWLRVLLLMFTDCLSIPVYCWLWIRLCSNDSSKYSVLFSAFIAVSGIICIDHHFVSPFLVEILS